MYTWYMKSESEELIADLSNFEMSIPGRPGRLLF